MPSIKVAVYPAEQSNPTGAEVLAETVPNALYFDDASAPTTDTTDHTIAAAGLAEGTAYRPAVVWDDGSVQSPVAIGPVFRTVGPYAVGPLVVSSTVAIAVNPSYTITRVGVRETVYGADQLPAAHRSGIVAVWWDSQEPDGMPALVRPNIATDGDGVVELDLTGWTGLAPGADGFLVLYDLDSVDHRRSPGFMSRMTVVAL